jgi:hypothetical protein
MAKATKKELEKEAKDLGLDISKAKNNSERSMIIEAELNRIADDVNDIEVESEEIDKELIDDAEPLQLELIDGKKLRQEKYWVLFGHMSGINQALDFAKIDFGRKSDIYNSIFYAKGWIEMELKSKSTINRNPADLDPANTLRKFSLLDRIDRLKKIRSIIGPIAQDIILFSSVKLHNCYSNLNEAVFELDEEIDLTLNKRN